MDRGRNLNRLLEYWSAEDGGHRVVQGGVPGVMSGWRKEEQAASKNAAHR